MKARILTVSLFLSLVFLTGCSVGRGIVDIKKPKPQGVAQSNLKEVYIASVVDKRIFEIAPKSAASPSLDHSQKGNEQIKPRAIGRKSNSLGTDLGDIVLPESKTVSIVIENALKQAFIENGYTVIESKDDVTTDTYIADVTIHKFWSWMQPGTWEISINTEIETKINLKKSLDNKSEVIYVIHSEHFQTSITENWVEVINNALRIYINKVKIQY